MIFEEKLIFYPSQYPDGDWEPLVPKEVVLEDVFFESDGLKLHGWFLRPCKPLFDGAVLFCHGNAGNLSSRYPKALAMALCGVAVFLFDYRGYGRSEMGSVSEKKFYEDSSAAWDWLCSEGYESIVVHGISLGGGAATYLAVEKNPVGLSLESTFTSMPDMSHEVYPFIPRFLIASHFNNFERIPQVKIPLQVIHGTEDELIPHWMGVKLFDAAICEKEFISIDGAGHGDLMEIAGDSYAAHFRTLLEKVLVAL